MLPTNAVSPAAPNESAELFLLLEAFQRLHAGDFAFELSPGAEGVSAEFADVFNRHIRMLNGFAGELTRIAREMGTESRYGGRWKYSMRRVRGDMAANVNFMAANLTDQIRDMSNVCHAVSDGDFSKRVSAPCRGEMANLHTTLNSLLDAKRIGTVE